MLIFKEWTRVMANFRKQAGIRWIVLNIYLESLIEPVFGFDNITSRILATCQLVLSFLSSLLLLKLVLSLLLHVLENSELHIIDTFVDTQLVFPLLSPFGCSIISAIGYIIDYLINTLVEFNFNFLAFQFFSLFFESFNPEDIGTTSFINVL
jgi:hypothetical protein